MHVRIGSLTVVSISSVFTMHLCPVVGSMIAFEKSMPGGGDFPWLMHGIMTKEIITTNIIGSSSLVLVIRVLRFPAY